MKLTTVTDKTDLATIAAHPFAGPGFPQELVANAGSLEIWKDSGATEFLLLDSQDELLGSYRVETRGPATVMRRMVAYPDGDVEMSKQEILRMAFAHC